MSTEQDPSPQDQPGTTRPVQQQQQQQQNQDAGAAGHGGCGSDSAMQQMRVWEQHRAAHSGGRRRQGPQ